MVRLNVLRYFWITVVPKLSGLGMKETLVEVKEDLVSWFFFYFVLGRDMVAKDVAAGRSDRSSSRMSSLLRLT